MTISRRTITKLAGASTFASLLNIKTTAFAQGDSNVLRLAMHVSDIQTLDPHYASGTQDRVTVAMVFNGLVRYKPGDFTEFEPDLAAEMPTSEENEDGTQTWTFALRPGVMTHSTVGAESYELTVDDVLFSFQKAAAPDSSAFAGDYEGWEFAIEGNDNTFQITVPEPISATLFLPKVSAYAGGYIIPRKGYEAIGADGFITQPVGTGPFAFESHTPQNNVTLVAHSEYFLGTPELDAVEVRFLADHTSRELALLSGDVDVIYGLPESQWVERMNEREGIIADVFGPGESIWLNLDIEHEILQDVRVREAIFLAIDRNNYVALPGELIGQPIYSVVPYELMPGGLSQQEAEDAGVNLTPNLDRARELLAEAGYPDGFELDLVTSESAQYRRYYEVLIEELRQVGIEASLEVVQHATMHELIRQGRNAIVIYIAFRPSADTYLTQFFTTEGGVTNFSNFTVDELRDQARTETDADVQAQLWKDAAIEIQRNFAGTGLMYNKVTYARSERVDYGHELESNVPEYPGINETTSITDE